VEIYNNYNWKTEVLAASIRHPIHVIETAHAGADVATMPFKVMQQLIKHPLTDKRLDQFSPIGGSQSHQSRTKTSIS
jgi:transaldolase